MCVYLLLIKLMKKIAITGHTGQLGSSMAKAYSLLGYQIIGLSRKTGYDITDNDDRSRLLSTINSCDVFVNSAHVGYEQVSLLKEVKNLWRDNSNKLIVSISSLDVDFPSKIGNYFDQKRLLDKTHWELIENSKGPMMCLAKAGKAPTEENFDDWSMELVKQLENPNYYTLEFSILKRQLTI